MFSLAGVSAASLTYTANYQNFAGLDFLDVDISTNGGTTWTNLLSWNEDHGTYGATPGVNVTIDLSAYAGQSGLMLRYRYYDPNSERLRLVRPDRQRGTELHLGTRPTSTSTRSA